MVVLCHFSKVDAFISGRQDNSCTSKDILAAFGFFFFKCTILIQVCLYISMYTSSWRYLQKLKIFLKILAVNELFGKSEKEE